MSRIISISVIASLSLFISACSLSPNLNIPEANYSLDNKLGALSWEKENNHTLSKEWWEEFDDEELNYVVDLAFQNDNDLKPAFIHMEQAAAQLSIDFSDLLPKLDGSASTNRVKTSTGAPNSRTGGMSYGNDFKMGLDLSYEIDLWGRYRDTYHALRSGFKASRYDYEAARLSIISSVVQTYFSFVNANENGKVLKDAYGSVQGIYQVNYKKFQVGAIGEYEIAQSRVNLESTTLQYNEAKLNKENYLKALKILTPNDLNDTLYQDQAYQVFRLKDFGIPSGISSTIFLQCPDIGSSLEKLTQQNYLVGVARTAFLPNLSLTGLLGFESGDLNILVEAGSRTWSIGENFVMPVFHWGEVYQNVSLTKLNKDEASVNYRNTSVAAFGGIRYALIARKTIHLQYNNAQTSELSYKRIYEISEERYDVGGMSLQDCLQAHQDWSNVAVASNNTKYSYANSIVNVIKAFGGGFEQGENISKNIEEESKVLDMSLRE